jgi:hypothetical protein
MPGYEKVPDTCFNLYGQARTLDIKKGKRLTTEDL